MSYQRIAAIFGGLVIAGLFFFLGRSSCPQPEDGNPIGFHLHGLAKIDHSLDVSKCNPECVVKFNVNIAKNGGTASSATCPTTNCVHFSGTQMLVQSTDDATPHPEETVSADGTLEAASSKAR